MTGSRYKQAQCKYQGYIQCDIHNKTLLTAKEVIKTNKFLNLAPSLNAINLIASSDGARFFNESITNLQLVSKVSLFDCSKCHKLACLRLDPVLLHQVMEPDLEICRF